jgi:hypothetical protein
LGIKGSEEGSRKRKRALMPIGREMIFSSLLKTGKSKGTEKKSEL